MEAMGWLLAAVGVLFVAAVLTTISGVRARARMSQRERDQHDEEMNCW